MIRKKMMLFALLSVAVVIGSGVAVYNMDVLYMVGVHETLVSLPEMFLSNSTGFFTVVTMDSNGNPAGGKDIVVELEASGHIVELFRGKSDENGFATPRFNVPEYVGNAKMVITSGDDKLVQNVKIVNESTVVRTMISTDKPIYQPGQIVHIRTLTFEGQKPKAFIGNITVTIIDPDGNKIFRKTLESNDFGIASLDYPLSDQLPLGTYKINVNVNGKEEEKSVIVKRYVLPKFRIGFEGINSWYTVNETITGIVNCTYIFGQPVRGEINLKARAYYGVWTTVYQEQDEFNGTYCFSIPPTNYAVGLPINMGNAYLELNATITDESGHAETKTTLISIARESIIIDVLPDTNVAGVNSTYYIVARYPDGKPVDNGDITYYLSNTTYHDITDEKGIAAFTFTYNGEDDLIVTVSKNNESSTKTITLKGDYIKVVSDKGCYTVGETMECDVFYKGSSFTKIAYYDVISKGFVVTTGHLILKNGKGSFTLSIASDMIGSPKIRVHKVEKTNEVIKDTLLLSVTPSQDVDVNIIFDKTAYKPHDDVSIHLHVQNNETPLVSAIGLSIVDQSIFELYERYGGFEETFFELEEEFMQPQYQINAYIFGEGETVPSTFETTSANETTVYTLCTYDAHIAAAEKAMENAVNRFWGSITTMGIVGYFGLIVLGIRYRPALTLSIGILVLISAVLPAMIYYVWVSGFMAAGGGGGEGITGGGVMLGGNATLGEGIWINDMVNAVDVDGGIRPVYYKIDEESGPTYTRSYFPETWYWAPSIITDENGDADVNLTAPDSITTWEIKAVSSTKDAELGVGVKNLTVFQEFFIEPDMPVSVVRNDEFPLRVLVYNYCNESKNVTVYLENSSWFTPLSELTQNVTVDSGHVSSVIFRIRAEDVGDYNVTVSGFNDEEWDKIIRVMTVEPDGKKFDETVNGELTDNQTVNITINLSDERVPKSENAYVILQGGMDAVVLDGAEKYIRFVSGCGEQSMSTLAIDILAFNITLNGTDEKLFEYENIVTQGIQHELTFLKNAENGIGRGIVWFPSDRDVHPWLTSWGLITFQDGRNAGFEIDESIIGDMQKWLVSQQSSDGSYVFPEWGLYETTNPILKSKKVATTAYVTRALLYSGYPQSSNAVQKSICYIEEHVEGQWDDPYTLSLALITLEYGNGNSPLRNSIAVQIDALKKEDNGTYWESNSSMITDTDTNYWYGGRCNGRITETTGYAIIALHMHGGYEDSERNAIKYLLNHRSGMGGFFSTQDTVVAFQALSTMRTINIESVQSSVFAENVLVETILFTDENKDITYLIDLRAYLKNNTMISVQTSGKGTILYQVYYEEYIPWDKAGMEQPGELILEVTYNTTNIAVNDTINATVTLQYRGNATVIKMLLIDLRAPTGFSFIEEDFEEYDFIDWYEIKDRQAIIYIENVHKNDVITFSYRLLANEPIKGVIQGVNAYDMYNPALNAGVEPVGVVSV
ncbi:MAG: hypothetical protein CO114_03245 [Euryarchaeota archaeon CG_4_9_14_3_um_filter_38_12]|nr:MAG: hypothetical protein CO114_03245 [Euryarchaeota archaeon CG_4_9_14_3_um_filter_38_12]